MTKAQRDILRKKRVLEHAEQIGQGLKPRDTEGAREPTKSQLLNQRPRYSLTLRMNLSTAQRSGSGITAPQGAMSGEAPLDAAPFVIVSKMS